MFFRAKWTADIHREWIDALLLNQPHRDHAVPGTHARSHGPGGTRDCLVTGYETLISALNLSPTPDDRHVLAAAITGHCDVIVTYNLQGFPEAVAHALRNRSPAPRRLSIRSPRPDARRLLRRRPNDTSRGWWHSPSPFKTISVTSRVWDSMLPPPNWNCLPQ